MSLGHSCHYIQTMDPSATMIELFAKQRQCLHLMGHHFVRDKSQLLQMWHNIKFAGVVMVVISAQWPMINYVIYHIDDMQLATASLSICFTNVLTVTKITTFLFYKWRFVKLMKKLEAMYLNCKYLAYILHTSFYALLYVFIT